MYKRRGARRICFVSKIPILQNAVSEFYKNSTDKLIPVHYFQSKEEVAQIKKDHPVCHIVPPKKRSLGRFSDKSFSSSFSTESSPTLSLIRFDPSRKENISPTYNHLNHGSYLDQVFLYKTKVAEGSFGKVYKVISKDDGKIYAIKKFHTETHSKRVSYKEIQNMEKIGYHFNLLRYIMSWEENGEIYSLMECCQMSLGQYTSVISQLPEQRIVEMLNDIAEALLHLHQKGYLHLDVKPDNILIERGFYKLCDFGLLREIGKPLKFAGDYINEGDSKYLAPEVLSLEVFTPKVDIFALGITVIETATGLFMPSNGDVWHEMRSGKVPATLPQLVSDQLFQLIIHMVDPAWDRRPSSSDLLQTPLIKYVKVNDKNLGRQDIAEKLSAIYSFINPFPLSERSIDNNANIEANINKNDFELNDTSFSINIISKLNDSSLSSDGSIPQNLVFSENNNEQNIKNKNKRCSEDGNIPIMETPKENLRPRRLPRLRLFNETLMDEF